jgi:hypothetical protein
MPARAEILGFENRWQAEALPHAVERALPSGARIRAAPPPYLLAMKLDAFGGRGRGDFIGSRDLEDIATLLDRRAEIIGEVRSQQRVTAVIPALRPKSSMRRQASRDVSAP